MHEKTSERALQMNTRKISSYPAVSLNASQAFLVTTFPLLGCVLHIFGDMPISQVF